MHCTRKCYGACKSTGKHLTPREASLRGPDHYAWRGGRIKRRGYWLLHMPEHHSILASQSKAKSRKYVLEHRVIMEGILGRNLLPSETVHHINGDGLDNRPENLQLRQGSHGRGAAFTCLDCGSHNVKSVRLAG